MSATEEEVSSSPHARDHMSVNAKNNIVGTEEGEVAFLPNRVLGSHYRRLRSGGCH